jgi:anhydro-N-acetylmuramic acid kinase
MANVTWLPPSGSGEPLLAFDTGPGVALLDAAAGMATRGRERMDRDGGLARAGRVREEILARLLAHPFFREEPPRSTGREVFGSGLVRGLVEEMDPEASPGGWPDLLATLTAFTARSIGDAYRRWVLPRGVDEIFLLGGGAHNPALARAIARELDPVPVKPGTELGMDPDAREAAAFALLAWAHLRGRAANVPEATGSSGSRVLGSLTPGPVSGKGRKAS